MKSDSGLHQIKGPVRSRRRNSLLARLRELIGRLSRGNQEGPLLSGSVWLIGLGLSIYIALFITPFTSITVDKYEIGQYTTRSIKAPMPFSVQDEKATEAKREEARASVLPVYDYDREIAAKAKERTAKAFTEMREFLAEYAAPPAPVAPADGQQEPVAAPTPREIPKDKLDEAYEKFWHSMGVTLPDEEMDALKSDGFSENLQKIIAGLIDESYSSYVVGDRNFFDQTMQEVSRKAFSRRELNTGKEKEISDLDKVVSLDQVRAGIPGSVKELMPDSRRALRTTVTSLVQALIEPSLTFAKAETQTRQIDAARKVAPVVAKYEKNQLIIGEGKLVTEETIRILEALEKTGPRSSFGLVFIGIAAMFFITLMVLFGFSRSTVRKFRYGNRDVLFLAALTMGYVLILWIGIAIAESITEKFGTVPMGFFMAAIPVATAAMMTRYILNSETALAYTPVAALLAGMMADKSLSYAIYTFVVSFTGAWAIGRASQRLDAIKAGLWISVVGMLVMMFSSFLLGGEQGAAIWKTIGFNVAGAALGGMLSALALLALSPVLEWIFGYTTDIKLMELANLNHPLIKEMILKAPGTYNHSILASTLAENAAEAIDANPLLAKVAALYHDIGKISKPHYFIENQRGQDNPHDKLYPRMSGLILTNHVKEGVELARDFNLGETVAQIIEQHHGTGLIRFFYERAKERTDPSMEQINEDDFRYRGPKPQTKEAALVMLADQVEAVSRVLKDPAPSRIRNLVNEQIDFVFSDGQLDECDLTLRDIHKIAESFSHVLIGIFHQRIEYPENEKEESKTNGGDQSSPNSESGIRAVTV